MSKILVLTSSPQRDKLVDELLKKELESLGNEVIVRPIPYGAREAILEIKPDILVVPPVRNHFAYDLTEVAARYGIAVAIRHIEPSCDEDDINNMDDGWRKRILIRRPEDIKLELVWSPVEMEYVEMFCNPPHKMVAVGAFVADVYKSGELQRDIGFHEKYGFDPNKPTVLASSPWGLCDSDSDKLGSSTTMMLGDIEARNRWLDMIKGLKEAIGDTHNILATLHPGLMRSDVYQNVLGSISVPIDIKSTATYLLTNSDYLVHSGSTLAVEMHWLNKPSFQFGDINSLEMSDGNWWHQKNTPISQVSPFFENGGDIADAIAASDNKSNANIGAIEKLEKGRFGLMDGNATSRAAAEIDNLKGSFRLAWPKPTFKSRSPLAMVDRSELFLRPICPICKEQFWLATKKYLELFTDDFKLPKPLLMPPTFECPSCGSPLSNEQEFNILERKSGI